MAELTIPPEEFRDRQRRAVEAARERDLDALLVWSRGGTSVDFYGDILYLANHHSPFPPNQDTTQWSARSYSALVLPVDDDPTLIVDLPNYPRDRIYLDDIRYDLRIPHTVADVLNEKRLAKARVGLVGTDTFLRSHHRIIENELGHALNLEPADEILERLRVVKSKAELRMVRKAADVGVGWMRTMMEFIEPGRTEGEVVGEGLRYLAANGGFPYDVAIASGPASQQFFGRIGMPAWRTDRKLEDGDLVHIDAWGPVEGYYTDFVRSTVVGRKPTEAQREILEGATAMIGHIIEGVQPGVEIGELYLRGTTWLEENGFSKHRVGLEDAGTDFGQLFPAFGHSIGLGLEPPWIIEGDPTVVEKNMALAVECLVGRPDVGGAGFEEDLIVTSDGAEVLTDACPQNWWD